MKNEFVFFWGGIYSNWYPSNFTLDGVKYNCAEQAMMAKKALLFGDQEAHNKIMAAKDPRDQKALGRTVKGFTVETWDKVAKDIVYEIVKAKFTQNKGLLTQLLSTGNKELVEASPQDKIWGIGLAESDPRAWDKSTWLGTNWLGETLTKLKNDVFAEKKPFTEYSEYKQYVQLACEKGDTEQVRKDGYLVLEESKLGETGVTATYRYLTQIEFDETLKGKERK